MNWKRYPGWIIALAASTAAAFLVGSTGGWSGASSSTVAPHRDAATVSLGQSIYAAECASCHGNNLEGQPDWQVADADGYLPAPPHDETGHTWHHPDALLMRIVRDGTAAVVGGGYRSNMPGFGDRLSDDEIRAVLAYIKSGWPDRVVEVHDRINAGSGD